MIIKHVLFILFLISGISTCNAQKKNPTDFLPEGYVLFEEYTGNLNNDGQEDVVLIIKGTDEEDIVINHFDKKVDRNRRGILVLFKKNDHYELIVENRDCFYSENEDGGVYFPPELWIIIEEGNLIVHYGHGRYGYWQYIFKFQKSNFQLIGYNSSRNRGPVINTLTSINFLTKTKLIKENTNQNAEGGNEIFKETHQEIEIEELIKLSEIEDFSELDMSVF